MRTTEIILLAFVLITMLLLYLWPKRSRWMNLLIAGIAGLIILSNILLDGYRWQMIPTYFLTLIFVSLSLIGLRRINRNRLSGWSRALILFLAFLCFLIAILVPIMLPVPTLPVPDGQFPVGTTIFHLVDEDRIEPYGEIADAPRELMVQLWYPAEQIEKESRAAYIDQFEKAAPIIARRLGLPSFLLQHLNLARTHSYQNAQLAISATGFPLILFSHGLAGLRMQNSVLFEHLASHGYIVASADHTFDSIFTVFPDGQVTLHRSEAIFPENVTMLEAGGQLIDVRTKDLQVVIDSLIELADKESNLVTGAINFDKIGIVGHSTGGGTALLYCLEYSNCQAVLALDGWLEPLDEKSFQENLGRPSMFINTSEWLNRDNQRLGQDFIAWQDDSAYEITVTGMNHNNFTDIPLLSPLTSVLGLTGPIDSDDSLKIINDFSLAFFDQHILGKQQALLHYPENWPPEVQLRSNRQIKP